MPEATTSIDYVMEKASGPHFSGLRIDGPTSSPPASSATAPSVADVNAPKQPFVIGNWLTFALSLFLFPPNFNFWWVNFSFFVLDEPFLLGFNLARVLFLFKGNQFLCVLLVRAIWKCFLLILEAILLILKTLLVHNLVHVWWSSFENCLCCLLIWNCKEKKKCAGVSGGTASGKTTVCDMIIQQLHDHRVVLVNQVCYLFIYFLNSFYYFLRMCLYSDLIVIVHAVGFVLSWFDTWRVWTCSRVQLWPSW